MNKGLFFSQINEIESILANLGIDLERNYYPNYSSVNATLMRNMTYLDAWNTCIKERLFDFILNDYSILQFRVDSFDPILVGYNYYESPFSNIIYRDYVEKIWNLEFEIVGYELMPEYEQYTMDCPVKDMVTPLRYDFAPNLYQEGRHPASHLHFGYRSQIRVGTKKKLVKPLSFLFFVLRQCYPDKWQAFLNKENAPILCRNIRENLDDVENDYWGPKDNQEMILV